MKVNCGFSFGVKVERGFSLERSVRSLLYSRHPPGIGNLSFGWFGSRFGTRLVADKVNVGVFAILLISRQIDIPLFVVEHCSKVRR